MFARKPTEIYTHPHEGKKTRWNGIRTDLQRSGKHSGTVVAETNVTRFDFSCSLQKVEIHCRLNVSDITTRKAREKAHANSWSLVFNLLQISFSQGIPLPWDAPISKSSMVFGIWEWLLCNSCRAKDDAKHRWPSYQLKVGMVTAVGDTYPRTE